MWPPPLFWKKGFFFSHTRLCRKKRDSRQKKSKLRLFPQLSYAFLKCPSRSNAFAVPQSRRALPSTGPRAPSPPGDAAPHFSVADQALTYLEQNAGHVFNASVAEATVVDYTWRTTRPSVLPYALPPRWSFITAMLPDPVPALKPWPDPVPPNQVLASLALRCGHTGSVVQGQGCPKEPHSGSPPPHPPISMDLGCASGCPWSMARATAPSPGRPTPRSSQTGQVIRGLR